MNSILLLYWGAASDSVSGQTGNRTAAAYLQFARIAHDCVILYEHGRYCSSVPLMRSLKLLCRAATLCIRILNIKGLKVSALYASHLTHLSFLLHRYWEKAGVAHKVDGRLGPAEDGLRELLQQEGENSFEMAFIDADKRSYQSYFDHCLRLVRPGGLIAVDNVLFYGKVADPEAQDKATKALKRFNSQLMTDERVTYSIVPIGDGMALCRKR